MVGFWVLSICRRCGDVMESVTREIKRFVRDALESRGVIQGVRTVEVGLEEELEQYLRKNGLDVGDLLETLMDMKEFGEIVWYYIHGDRKIVVLDVSDKYK
jgi:hypothetical protein